MNNIQLNDEQLAAATYGENNLEQQFESSPLLIIAGAGTGKTNTLAHRAAHLIVNHVSSERILLMTFSRRAAKELVDRTKRIVSQEIKQKNVSIDSVHIPWMGTFHSIANRLLREHSHAIGLHSNFTIIDNNDAADLIDLLRHELSLSQSNKRFPKKSTCLNIYSRCVNSQLNLKEVLTSDFPWCEDWEHELSRLFRLYCERKAEQVSLDYDDLLLYWFHMVSNQEIAKLIGGQFDHVLVDEYQDTNRLQSGILKRLFPSGKGLTVVGDDAQSIYRFRSAEIENILNFPEQFVPAAKVISLKTNYRSTQPILDLSNVLLEQSDLGYKRALICNSKEQSYQPKQKPLLISVEDDQAQAKYIVEQVLKHRELGTDLRQQAVLFRSGYHSDRLEIELMRSDIPFVKYGGLKFLEAAHVKDLLSIIRWLNNPKHQLSGNRVLRLLPNLGPSLAKKALDFLKGNNYQFSALASFSVPINLKQNWSILVNFLIKSQSQEATWPNQMELAQLFYLPLLEEKYEDYYVRSGDIEQLASMAQQFSSVDEFVSELTLDPPSSTGDLTDKAHKDDDFLILSTVHSAKGQEWENVFILNVADGNFPSEYSTGNTKEIEEERRLLNVAITRAKKGLHLIQPLRYWVPEQMKYGKKHVYGAKSRFLTSQVMEHLDKTYYPQKFQQAAEPVKKSSYVNEIQRKINQMW
jgi:DNA helicase-2/ATP-dependent DNA helicase PcrA